MDWSFTEEQEQIAALTRAILDRELTEERRRSVGAFDADLYRTLSDAGLFDPSLDLIELCRVLIEIGRAVAPLPAAAVAVARRFAPGDATLPTLALADDLNPETRAVRTGDDFVLTGAKTTVQAGTVADLYLVSAVMDDSPALFAVPHDVAGLETRKQIVTNTEEDALIELNQVRAAHVGDEEVVRSVIDHYTVALCAVQLGVCESALELTASYAKQRVQFDRPIATFQAVGQRLADGFIDVEAIRLTLWQAAWRLCDGLPAATEIATAKFWASDAGHRVAHTAVHVHGGVGVDLDYRFTATS